MTLWGSDKFQPPLLTLGETCFITITLLQQKESDDHVY